ncbi:hypothetical protein ACVW05_000446 [Pseudomonas fulva]
MCEHGIVPALDLILFTNRPVAGTQRGADLQIAQLYTEVNVARGLELLENALGAWVIPGACLSLSLTLMALKDRERWGQGACPW